MTKSLALAASTFLLAVSSVLPALAHGSDDLDPEQDNPKGCETASSEADDGCGAQGREHFSNAAHKPPIEACKTTKAKSGSVITRVIPKGPTRDDGSLAFTSGVCIYLPPGYAQAKLRYPVIFLLHGGGGDQAAWVSMGNVRGTLDSAYAKDSRSAVIAVMPDGRSGQWHDYYNRRFLMETYVIRYLVPYIDRHYRTIADRSARAIVGLSNGGYGAMHFAAKRPDLFRVAGSMSGNLGARSMGNLGTPLFDGGPASQEAGSFYYGNVPIELAPNLDNVDLVMDWGASCEEDVSVDLCATWGAEQAFRTDNQAFRDRLMSVKHKGTLDYREAEGSHAWRWWSKWLAERHAPFALKRLRDPVPASHVVTKSKAPWSFRYRSISRSFSVWSYRFDVQRSAPEFLDLLKVSPKGLTVRGSGKVEVETAPRYLPGGSYAITSSGSKPQAATADFSGRLSFTIDLGPGNTEDQYSPAGRAAASQDGYFTTKKVTITKS